MATSSLPTSPRSFPGDSKRDPTDVKAADTTRLTRLCSSGQVSAHSAEVEENSEAPLLRNMRRHSGIFWSCFVEMGGAYSSGIPALRRPTK
jgi:hypothetical protein